MVLDFFSHYGTACERQDWSEILYCAFTYPAQVKEGWSLPVPKQQAQIQWDCVVRIRQA